MSMDAFKAWVYSDAPKAGVLLKSRKILKNNDARGMHETDGPQRSTGSENVVDGDAFDTRAKAYEAANGNVLNTDSVKLLFLDDGYDPTNEDSVRRFHPAAAELTGRLFDRWLETKRDAGDGSVVFLGGGNGAGKSTVAPSVVDAAFVMDSTMANLEATIDGIDKAIAAGFRPRVQFVYRDPVDAWENGVLNRVEDGEHITPKSVFAGNHARTRKNLDALVDHFGERLNVLIIEVKSGAEAREITLDELRSKAEYTKEQILEALDEQGNSQADTAAEEKSEKQPEGGSESAQRGRPAANREESEEARGLSEADEIRFWRQLDKVRIADYVPAESLRRVGRQWSYSLINGGESPALFKTKREALAAAEAHKSLFVGMYDNPTGFDNAVRLRASRSLDLIKQYMNQGKGEMEAGKLAQAEVERILKDAAESNKSEAGGTPAVQSKIPPKKTLKKQESGGGFVSRVDGAQGFKILEVVDTREWVETRDDQWEAVAGSGKEHQCDRCGRNHEIHFWAIDRATKKKVCLGGSCVTESGMVNKSQHRTALGAARAIARYAAEVSRIDAQLSAYDSAAATLGQVPDVESRIEENRFRNGRPVKVWSIGDAERFDHDQRRQLPANEVEFLKAQWMRNRIAEKLGVAANSDQADKRVLERKKAEAQTKRAAAEKRLGLLTQADAVAEKPGIDFSAEWFKQVRVKAQNGDLSLNDFMAAADYVSENEALIKEVLNGMTKPDLDKAFNVSGWRSLNEIKKDKAVSKAYTNLLDWFQMGKAPTITSYSMDYFMDAAKKAERDAKERKETLERIHSITEQDLKAYAAKASAQFEERSKAVDAHKNAIENPQTLDDFSKVIRARGFHSMTAEQVERWDRLKADEALDERKAKKTDKAQVAQIANDEAASVGMSYSEGKHSKTGEALHIVSMNERVDRDAFNELSAKAKRLGGRWAYNSRYGGGSDGFNFKSKDSADAFMALQSGDVDRSEAVEADMRSVEERAAERLIGMADKMEEGGEDRLNADRQVNTARRAQHAASAMDSAEKQIKFARILRNVAEAVRRGEAKYLAGIRASTQLEALQREINRAKAEWNRLNPLDEKAMDYRQIEAARSARRNRAPTLEDIRVMQYPGGDIGEQQARELVAKLRGVRGQKLFSDQLAKGITKDGINLNLEAMERIKGALGKDVAWFIDDALTHVKRLHAMGLEHGYELRMAAREYLRHYEDGPRADPMRLKLAEIQNKKYEGFDFFPTPERTAREIAQWLEVEPGMTVLEPSAGLGALADAVKAEQPDAVIEVVEPLGDLREVLQHKGYELIGRDFEEIGPDEKLYDRIIMNPPFSKSRDIKHVQRAYDLLRPGGKLAAITSAHWTFASDKESVAFREWLGEVDGSQEELGQVFNGPDAFRKTGVNSVLVKIEKPETRGGVLRERPRVGFGAVDNDLARDVGLVRATTNLSGLKNNNERRGAVAAIRREKFDRNFINQDTGWEIYIGRNVHEKALSGKALRKTSNPLAHFDAAAAMDRLIEEAVLLESHEDRRGSDSIHAIHRFFAALESGGKLYRVKITVKDVRNAGHKFYTHELQDVEIEKPPEQSEAGLPREVSADHTPPAATVKLSRLLGMSSDGRVPGSVNEQPHIGFGFYSPLERALEGFGQETFTAQQLKGMLAKASGVKAEELDDLGFNDWLDGVDGKVTKQQALKFVRAGGPQLEEVVKADDIDPFYFRSTLTDDEDERLSALAIRKEDYGLTPDEEAEYLDLLAKNEADIAASNQKRRGATKFGEHALPGGENYREVMLLLPEVKRVLTRDELLESARKRYKAMSTDELVDEYKDRFNRSPLGLSLSGIIDSLVGEIRSERVEVADTAKMYQVPHAHQYGDESDFNRFAHLRLNDRKGPSGEKILFIEEIQSDWHQAGRKKGYETDESKIPTGTWAIVKKGERRGNNPPLKIVATLAEANAEMDKDESVTYIGANTWNSMTVGVPNAPFKKSWAMLAFKRVLKLAVDEGYDSVAWTPGEVQADRYDLSKQVDSVETFKLLGMPEDEWRVQVYKAGATVYNISRANTADLENLIGKDLAQKIVDAGEGSHSFSGLDLKVGGEGMKGFYDRILPAEVGRYVKRFGGRVATVVINAGEKLSIRNQLPEDGDFISGLASMSPVGKEVWNLPITPELRGMVSQGQALYERLDAGRLNEYLKKREVEHVGQARDELREQWDAAAKEDGTPYETRETRTADAGRESGAPGRTGDAAARAIVQPDNAEALRDAFASGEPVSSVVERFVSNETPNLDWRGTLVRNARDFAALLMPLRSPYIESVKVAYLDKHKRVISAKIVSVGLMDSSLIDAQEILRGLPEGTAGVIVAHNHPSGDPSPSKDDVLITNKIRSALGLSGIPLYDHIITDGGEYVSLRDIGYAKLRNNELLDVESPLGDVKKRRLPPEMRSLEAWERVPRRSLKIVADNETIEAVTKALRQADEGNGHAVIVNSINGIVGIERIPIGMEVEKAAGLVMRAASRMGGNAFFLDWPVRHTLDQVAFVNELIELSENEMNLPMVDISTLDKQIDTIVRDNPGGRVRRVEMVREEPGIGFGGESTKKTRRKMVDTAAGAAAKDALLDMNVVLAEYREAYRETAPQRKTLRKGVNDLATEARKLSRKLDKEDERLNKIIAGALDKLRDFGVPEKKMPKTLTGVAAAAFHRGERVEREKGYIMALKDAFRAALEARIKEYRKTVPEFESNPGPTIQLLESLSGRIEAVMENLGGVIDDADTARRAMRDELIKKSLEDFFGEEYYLLIRRATHGGRSATFTALRDWMGEQLSDHYAKGVEYELEHLDVNHMTDEMRGRFDELMNSGENSVLIRNVKRLHAERGYLKKLRADHETPDRVASQQRRIKAARESVKELLKNAAAWDDLRRFYGGLSSLRAEQEINVRYARDARRGLVQETAEEIAIEAQDIPEIGSANEKDPARRSFLKALFGDFSASMGSYAQMIAGGKLNSTARRVFYTDMADAEERADSDVARFQREFDALRKEHGISDSSLFDYKTRLVARDLGGGAFEFTQAELMNLYAHMQDAEALAALAWGIRSARFNKVRSKTFTMKGEDGLTNPDSTLWEIEKMVNRELTDDQKAFVRGVIRIKNRGDVIATANEMAMRLEGRWLFFNENHWRLRRTYRDRNASAANIQDFNAYRQQMLDNLGMTKDRTLNRHSVFAVDFFNEAEEQVHDMAYYSNMAWNLRVAWETMGHGAFRDAVVPRFGGRFVTDMQKRLLETANLRAHVDEMNALAKGMSRVERWNAAGILALRATAILANRIGGSVMAWSQMGHYSRDAARHFALHNGITPLFTKENRSIVNRLMENGYLFKRWRIDPLRTYGALGVDSSDDLFKSRKTLFIRNLQQKMMHPMASAEIRNSVNMFKAFRAAGYSDGAAVAAIVDLTRLTQNPSSSLDETTFYANLKESGMGLFIPFMGQPSVIRNMVVSASLERRWSAKNGSRDERRDANSRYVRTLTGLVLSAMTMAAIREAFRLAYKGGIPDDDDDRDYEVTNTVMEACGEIMEGLIPGGGRVLRMFGKLSNGDGSFVNRLRGAMYNTSDFDALPMRAAKQLVMGATDIVKYSGDGFDEERVERGVTRLLDGLSMWSGGILPPGGVVQILRAVFGVSGHPLGDTQKKTRRNTL